MRKVVMDVLPECNLFFAAIRPVNEAIFAKGAGLSKMPPATLYIQGLLME